MESFLNIAGYHFAPLDHLPALKEQLTQLCSELELKGTILLSSEGINFFVAGVKEATNQLLTELRKIPGFSHLEVKESESAKQPFRRMLVKIKKEIISFGVEGIDPAHYSSPRVAPKKLKEWLDEKKTASSA